MLLIYAKICATPSVTILFTFFLPAGLAIICYPNKTAYLRIARRGPLRVRALVFVRCPRNGRLRR